MLPVALNLSRLRVALVGQSGALARRLAQLQEAEAAKVTVFEHMDFEPWSSMAIETPKHPFITAHHYRLPESHEIRQANILLVAGLDEQKSAVLAGIARLQGVLVWVEDMPDLCDFYFTGVVRRGDLLISVSTSGASPTLAREIKEYLAELFGEEWEGITLDIGEKRKAWLTEGLKGQEINERTKEWITANNVIPAKAGTTREVA